jgi:hypothetical protein
MTTSQTRWFKRLRWGMLAAMIAASAYGVAQKPANRSNSNSPEFNAAKASPESVADPVRVLQEQVRELQTAVAEMRADWQQSRAETAELRRQLDQVRTGVHDPASANAVAEQGPAPERGPSQVAGSSYNLPNNAPPDQSASNQSAPNLQTNQPSEHPPTIEEQYELLRGKVDDQYQTKVESASKYRVRLSGIVLMNLARTQGSVDSIDLPTIAYAHAPGQPSGSFGATLRQSEVGLEAFGPTVAGAKTTADLQLDLAGGFPAVPNGVSSGFMRLRTATLRMDWTNTSIVVGQDGIFFSPNSPTSFATLAIPALTYAGNLWSWVPQIRVEHKVALAENSNLLFQAGILDPLSGETPTPAAGYYRQAGPGEASRQPADGARIAWTRNVFGQPLRLGVGSYYSRQDYGFGRNVDGWAAMTDIELPLTRQFSLSGKLYRGKALGGLYGSFGESVLFNGNPTSAATQVQPLNSVGGWAQLKYRPLNKWEFNVAFGTDNPYASDLKYFEYPLSYGNPTLARNQGSFVNMIYRPRSDLLFSAEYRHLTTYSVTDGRNDAGHLNLMMGVLF